MSYEVGKQALDFLVANSGNRRNLEVDFFGGEPALKLPGGKGLVAYGRSLEKEHDKHFRFTLTTNGVLLNDDVMDFVNREMDNVVLSIDGRKEVHNRMRPFRNGGGSYDLIVPKFQKLADSRGQERYYVRGTFTRNNLDFSEDVLHLADLGFKQILGWSRWWLMRATITHCGRRICRSSLRSTTGWQAEMVRRHGTEKDFNFFHFMIDLEGGPCVAKRLSGCGSGTEYLAVTPTGDLYPCHQFVGKSGFSWEMYGMCVARISGTSSRSAMCTPSRNAGNALRDSICSGGCAANAYNFHGDIHEAYDVGCALQKKRIECAIMIKAATAGE